MSPLVQPQHRILLILCLIDVNAQGCACLGTQGLHSGGGKKKERKLGMTHILPFPQISEIKTFIIIFLPPCKCYPLMCDRGRGLCLKWWIGSQQGELTHAEERTNKCLNVLITGQEKPVRACAAVIILSALGVADHVVTRGCRENVVWIQHKLLWSLIWHFGFKRWCFLLFLNLCKTLL